MSNLIPDEWEQAALSSLIAPDGIFSDGDWVESKDQDPNGLIRLLQLADIGDGIFLNKSKRFINEVKFEELRCTELFENDVLVARMPSPLGRACLMPKLPQRCITVVDVAVIRPGKHSVSSRWLKHLLNSPIIRQTIDTLSSGTTRQRISRKNLGQLNIPVPPLNEQERIADKLDALLARVDACRDQLERIPHILERFRQAVLTAGTSGQLTEDWRINRMAQMQAEPQINTTASLNCDDSNQDYDVTKLPLLRLLREPLQNGRSVRDGNGAWVLRLTSIRKGEIDLQERKQGLWSRNDAIRFFVQEGDFLVARGNGSLRLVGRGGLVGKVTEEVAYPDTMIRIRPNTSLIAPEFLTIIWDANSVREQIEQVAKTTAGIWKISQSDLEGIILDVPTLEEQSEIILRVEVLFAYAEHLETRYRKACAIVDQLTSALLDKSFRGELVPQDPNDEPASVLLERIRVMRKNAEENMTKPRQRKPTANKTSQLQAIMLKRKDIQPSHLSNILRVRGSMTAETLWSASQLEIDDFYDQLKDEEANGLLTETREESVDAPRLLETV